MTRLLVVDDHDVVRQGLVTTLKSCGYTSIESATTIKESRSKIAAFNPEAIIVDINLPDGSGLELVQWIRKISGTVAIIVLSLNEPSLFAHLARNAGANAYVSKSRPVDEIG